ncbi:Component of the BRCA1-A complex [Desmophyllum pertusum]|uniref:Component of the BRCA1-A complex n=1 Tax=Desmophyllum pertusum TaxID=174260 RepID=A0A9W9Z8X3_9CNID|nr:Component of the BRCA1-A complex [Desmophyllum pertusum]
MVSGCKKDDLFELEKKLEVKLIAVDALGNPLWYSHLEIYDYFCDMDEEEEGYMLEVSRSTTRLFDHMAALLAHPLQRPKQRDTYYKLTPRADEESNL